LWLVCCFGGQEEDSIKTGETGRRSKREVAVAATTFYTAVATIKDKKYIQTSAIMCGRSCRVHKYV
jgi:hypothetical protein